MNRATFVDDLPVSATTPGPWIVDAAVASQVRQPNGSKRRRIVCPPDANGFADARLIAAAPEMLAALRVALQCHDDGDEWSDDFAEGMRAILAKATGGAQ